MFATVKARTGTLILLYGRGRSPSFDRILKINASRVPGTCLKGCCPRCYRQGQPLPVRAVFRYTCLRVRLAGVAPGAAPVYRTKVQPKERACLIWPASIHRAVTCSGPMMLETPAKIQAVNLDCTIHSRLGYGKCWEHLLRKAFFRTICRSR